jgi:hypothetical protein
MEYIGETFEMEYGGGRTVFSADTPRRWKGSLDIWAWDYYNLYFYEFYFSNNKSWISILLQSDTGLWDILDDINDYKEFEKKLKIFQNLILQKNHKQDYYLLQVLKTTMKMIWHYCITKI